MFFIRKTLFIKYKKHKKYNIFCLFNDIYQNLIFDVFSKVIILVFVYNEKSTMIKFKNPAVLAGFETFLLLIVKDWTLPFTKL